MDLAIGDAAAHPRIVAFPDDGDIVGAGGEMAVEAVHARVQGPVGEPADVEVLAIERGVLDRGEGLQPVQPLADMAPVDVGLGLDLAPGSVIAGGVHPGALRPGLGHGKNQIVTHVGVSSEERFTTKAQRARRRHEALNGRLRRQKS